MSEARDNAPRPAAGIAEAIKAEARRLGFILCGICRAQAPPGLDNFRRWLAEGYAGQMSYLPQRERAYAHPRHVLDGAESVVMLAMPYHPAGGRPPQPGEGRVARYAQGAADYHDVIHERLKRLGRIVTEQSPGAGVRGVVDTAPLLEREFAQLAGLGWVGKNTLLLNRRAGSYFFLAALLTDLNLPADEPHQTDHCGTCRACLDACPTDAFPQPYVLDATRCISYLTIELREEIPEHLRAGMGDWVFGCDICQEVCPWNRHAAMPDEPAFQPQEELAPLDLISLFDLDDESFRRRFKSTPLWRAKRRGLLRNAAIALGNRPTERAEPILIRGLSDREPLVRAACAWALSNYPSSRARAALADRQKSGLDTEVAAPACR